MRTHFMSLRIGVAMERTLERATSANREEKRGREREREEGGFG